MTLEAFQLDGKNALVTGSHKGLGAAMAVALARAGANVACNGRAASPARACEEIRALGGKTFYFAGDVANGQDCAALLEETVAEFGFLVGLINNAESIRRESAAAYRAEYWCPVMDVNL